MNKDWVPDKDVTACMRCGTQFTLTLRKHHCRICGQIVCGVCSDYKIPLSALRKDSKDSKETDRLVRVCNKCLSNCPEATRRLAISSTPVIPTSPTSPETQHERAYSTNGTDEDKPKRRDNIIPAPNKKAKISEYVEKRCLEILDSKETTQRYQAYLQTKKGRNEEEILTYRQFLSFSTIRSVDKFLFRETGLAYYMMREDGVKYVQKDSFLRFSPVLSPLASKLDAFGVYKVLEFNPTTLAYSAVDDSKDNESQSKKEAERPRGIRFNEFKLYVEALKKESSETIAKYLWSTFYEDFELDKEEKILCVRTGVADSSDTVPLPGRIALTTRYLVFESSVPLYRRRKVWKWTDITKAENLKGNFRPVDWEAIKFTTVIKEKGKIKEGTVIWDIAGLGAEGIKERRRTIGYIKTMIAVHKLMEDLSDEIPVANALLHEVCESIRRMRALEAVNSSVDPLIICPYTDEPDSQKKFVGLVRREVRKAEQIKQSKSSWVFKMFPKLQSDPHSQRVEADIDPELKLYPAELKSKAGRSFQKFNYKVFAKNFKYFFDLIEPFILAYSALKRLKRWENPFLTAFIALVLLNMAFRDYLGYLPAIAILFNSTILMLGKVQPELLQKLKEAVAEKDEREKESKEEVELEEESKIGREKDNRERDKEKMKEKRRKSLESKEDTEKEKEKEKEKDKKEFTPAQIIPTTTRVPIVAMAAPVTVSKPSSFSSSSSSLLTPPKSQPILAHAAVPVTVSSTAKPTLSINTAKPNMAAPPPPSPAPPPPPLETPKKKEASFIDKIKEMQQVAYKKYAELETAQNKLIDFNHRLMRIDGLYKWRSETASVKFVMYNVAAFFIFLIIPFRYIFSAIVIDQFTAKWQKEGSTMGRLLAEVPLPVLPDDDE